MATHQLGPEAPRPFAVLSEGYTKRVNLPYVPEYERYSFGDTYEKTMCEMIHRYLELGTDDNLCYVGEPKGSLAPMLQKNFCLLEPVTTVIPGHIHYEESPRHKMLPIKMAYVGAEEFFRNAASDKKNKYDKILLKDAISYFEDTRSTLRNVAKTMSEMGKILIIHRPAPMNTLPIFRDAKERLQANDHSYMSIIQDLQSLNLDVQWEVECLPIVMPKLKWLAMLRDKFPPQMEIISSYEVTSGLRELSEGVLKYEGENVEFMDRLMFITASNTLFSQYPSIQRFGANAMKPFPGMDDLKFKMEVTPDVKKVVPRQSKK